MMLYFFSLPFFLSIDPRRVSNDDKDVKARGIIEALKRDMAMLYDALCGTSYEKESILGWAWKEPRREGRVRGQQSVKSILHKADKRTLGA